jgi:DMSO/TMAO reductase YedYZ heme-binding membrane subunit
MFGFSASTLWYLTRGSGLVLLVVLTASVVVGILGSGGWAPRQWPRFVVTGLHRNLSLLAVALLVVHVLTAELDPFAPVGWLAVAVPFLSQYRAVWLGLGTLSVDILLAVVATSLVRPLVGYRTWKTVHWLAYLSWPVALLHCLGTGTDTRLAWAFVLQMICLAAVVVAAGARLRTAKIDSRPLRVGAALILVAFPVAVVAWAEVGPLRSGWARAAGTPTSLLASSDTTDRSSNDSTGAQPRAKSPPTQGPW